MKTRLHIDEITSYHIDALQNFTEPRVYNSATELIYEGQTPHAGYLLIEGEIHFIKRKKVFQKVLPGTLFGVSELMLNKPFRFTVSITPGSKVCILDRSTVKEILLELDDHKLPESFRVISA